MPSNDAQCPWNSHCAQRQVISFWSSWHIAPQEMPSEINPNSSSEPIAKMPWTEILLSSLIKGLEIMDGPRDCHTEWSKSDRERQISYDIAYIWNLKKWYKRTYLQSRNRVTDVEKILWLPRGKGTGRDKLGDWDWHIHTTIYKIDN